MRYFINIVSEAIDRPFTLTPEVIETLKKVRHEERCSNGGGGACHLVSEWIEAEWGFERVEGNYHESDGGRIITVAHFWNLLPNGSILDATADQFGEGHDIRLLAPNDPDYTRYQPRPEYNSEEDYEAGMDREEAQYQEARARDRANPAWWLKDHTALNAYDAKQQELYGRDPKWRTE